MLDGPVLSARVDSAAIQQDGDYLVAGLAVLPYFGSGTAKDDGYLLIPDGSGALVEFGTDKSAFKTYSQPVYGSDPSVNLLLKSVDAAAIVVDAGVRYPAQRQRLPGGDCPRRGKRQPGGQRPGYD